MALQPSTTNPELLALLNRSAELKAEAARLIAQARQVDQSVADQFCTIKIGDKVTVNGFSHLGKDMRAKRVEFLADGGIMNSGTPVFRVEGKVLRKDGSESGWDAKSEFFLDMQPTKGAI